MSPEIEINGEKAVDAVNNWRKAREGNSRLVLMDGTDTLIFSKIGDEPLMFREPSPYFSIGTLSCSYNHAKALEKAGIVKFPEETKHLLNAE
jgi:hypothetical protein